MTKNDKKFLSLFKFGVLPYIKTNYFIWENIDEKPKDSIRSFS